MSIGKKSSLGCLLKLICGSSIQGIGFENLLLTECGYLK